MICDKNSVSALLIYFNAYWLTIWNKIEVSDWYDQITGTLASGTYSREIVIEWENWVTIGVSTVKFLNRLEISTKLCAICIKIIYNIHSVIYSGCKNCSDRWTSLEILLDARGIKNRIFRLAEWFKFISRVVPILTYDENFLWKIWLSFGQIISTAYF